MNHKNPKPETYVPNETNEEQAILKTMHMALTAHRDDVEIMAYDGILHCYNSEDKHFLRSSLPMVQEALGKAKPVR